MLDTLRHAAADHQRTRVVFMKILLFSMSRAGNFCSEVIAGAVIGAGPTRVAAPYRTGLVRRTIRHHSPAKSVLVRAVIRL